MFSGEKLELIKKKGIYRYEYFNSFKKFKESKLPDIDCLFSSLKNRRIVVENIKGPVASGMCLK